MSFQFVPVVPVQRIQETQSVEEDEDDDIEVEIVEVEESEESVLMQDSCLQVSFLWTILRFLLPIENKLQYVLRYYWLRCLST